MSDNIATFTARVVPPIGVSIAPFTQGQFLVGFHVIPDGFDEAMPEPGFRFMAPDMDALGVLKDGAVIEMQLEEGSGEFLFSIEGDDRRFRAILSGLSQSAALKQRWALLEWMRTRQSVKDSDVSS